MTAYDQNNVFAKILRGELPCFKVHDDAKTLAFLDIMPRAPGHTLVIPKSPARNILDIAPADLEAVILVVKKIAIAGKAAFGADGVTIAQYNEKAGGQEVPHLHFHVIPRHDSVSMRPAASIKEDMAVLKGHADQLIAALKT